MAREEKNDISGIIRYKELEEENLHETIELAKNGDGEAFTQLACHLHQFLVKLQMKYFIQGADSDDVYQEGLVKLINVIEKFDKEKGGFVSFAQQSIEKHIITCITKQKAKKRHYLNNAFSLDIKIQDHNSQDDSEVSFVDNLEDSNPSEGFSPFDVINKDYEAFLVGEISDVLSDMENKVFYLRFIECLSYKDVAAEMGLFKVDKKGKNIPDQKSVDNAIMRSRPKIKKVLEKLGIAPKDIKNILKGKKSKKENKKSVKKKKTDEKKVVKKRVKKNAKNKKI